MARNRDPECKRRARASNPAETGFAEAIAWVRASRSIVAEAVASARKRGALVPWDSVGMAKVRSSPVSARAATISTSM